MQFRGQVLDLQVADRVLPSRAEAWSPAKLWDGQVDERLVLAADLTARVLGRVDVGVAVAGSHHLNESAQRLADEWPLQVASDNLPLAAEE